MIRRISVRNFRCLKEVDLDCSNLVALVGPNGSGKSALLHALRFFFGDLDLSEADCWGEDPDLTVEVALRIEVEGDDEELAAHRHDDGTILATRRSEPADSGRFSYYVTRRRGNPGFAELRAMTKATPAKEIYNELRSGSYAELPRWTSFPALSGVLGEWEAKHPEDLEWVEDRSIGFGGGDIDLAMYLEPVFVPAVQDAATESQGAGASTLGVLVERIVNPRGLFADSASEMDGRLRRQYKEMIAEAGDALGQAEGAISRRLGRFAPGAEVELEWGGRPPSVATPSVNARLVEGGHAAEIGRQGHGVQRAYILALLHELAEGASTADGANPLLLMLIEEPELYQHPTRARLLARLLSELTTGEATRTQVVYATHSPNLVSLDRITSLRMFRLRFPADHPSTLITAVNLDEVAEHLWTASGALGECFTAETLIPRLRLLAQMPVADGFFADGVILVEGEEDRAFVIAAAEDAGLDLDGSNVAVIPVGGKTNLDRPLLVFGQLGIPTYVLFDRDSGVPRNQRRANGFTNRLLLTLLGADPADNPGTHVNADWASFEETLERTIRDEVGEDLWDESLRGASDEAGYLKVEQARKNPILVHNAYSRMQQAGGSSNTLLAMMVAIRTKFGL